MNYNKNISKIKNMKTKKLPNLDESVLATLDFFQTQPTRRHAWGKSSLCFVVGSVNAYHTGRLLFAGRQIILADEGNFLELLKIYQPLIKNKNITEAFVISASGEKDSIWEIKAAQKAGLKTTLITCDQNSRGAILANNVIVSQKFPEPYSYNYSTYLGMILSQTGEDVKAIKKFLQKLKIPASFKKHNYFTFILPDKFKAIVDMLKVKDDEMFGPYSSLRAFSEGSARHAKFICESKQELVISFGKNIYFGLPGHRWDIKLPSNSNFAFILSLSYYLAGRIQAQRPPYFKRGIKKYCLKTGPAPYGRKEPFSIIVK